MSHDVKNNYSHPNLNEYRKQVDKEVALGAFKEYSTSVFENLQMDLFALTAALAELKKQDVNFFDAHTKAQLQNFLYGLKTSFNRIVSLDIALSESFPQVAALSDAHFYQQGERQRKEYGQKVETLEGLSYQEFWETIETEFQMVYASTERCEEILREIENKEDFHPLWEEAFHSSLGLEFLVRFFDKWLQNKGIFKD